MADKGKKKVNKTKTMDDYRKDQDRKHKRARIVAIVLIAVMLLFTFISTGLLMLN